MYIWFKYKKGESVEIWFIGRNVNELKEQIKNKLKNQFGKFDINQITLRAHGKCESLRAEMVINEAFETSYDKPTFCVQCYNKEGEPLDKFELFKMYNNEDLNKFLRRVKARGLENINDSNREPKVVTSFEDIQDYEYYRISASFITAKSKGVAWMKFEDMALENEMTLAVKNVINKTFKSPVKEFPNRIMHDESGKPIMEWDKILLCRDKVFLCESKYKITEEKIDAIVERVKEFPEKLKATKDFEFKQLSDMEYIGVACAMLFPIKLRQKSLNELGLIIAYPRGSRYCVKIPPKMDESENVCNLL
ncbi:hypothetical protein C1645_701088 [Glomus cerebriforme]|uniref:Uncharacterized protein n=1 Tax=Glomus cerebriforme TaxID=658196 RepID=A0A397S535_9GLOM|nr:hypothetical protein C1645_701088 [Glomus cerebriforme]